MDWTNGIFTALGLVIGLVLGTAIGIHMTLLVAERVVSTWERKHKEPVEDNEYRDL